MGIPVAFLVLALSSGMAPAQPRTSERSRAMLHYTVGVQEMRSEQWEKATAAFLRAVEIDSSFEMAYYALGRAYMPQKKYPEAAAAFTKCRDLYQADAGQNFSNSQEAQQRRRDRLTQIDDSIRQYQTGPQTAQSADVLRQLNETRRQLQDSLQRGVNVSLDASVPAFVSMALGSAYFRLGQLAHAEREYKATVAADPKTGEAFSNLAVVYLQTGRFDEAEKAVRNAEKTGFKVNPMLKEDIAAKKR